MLKKNYCMTAFTMALATLPAATYAAAAPGAATIAIEQQAGQCTGVVLDENGEPLIGANVTVKNSTAMGIITDLDGNFALANVAKGSTLVISFVGYQTKEVVWNGSKLTVRMDLDNGLLDEVVVVGYGTTTRKNFTGSVSTVKVSDSPLSLMPSSNALDALRGATTGITVSQQQGAGQSPSMVVRGQKSINGGSDPLIVMDGVIYTGSIRDIDPATIESMSVLKDATSLAAYGSQAANGVIMITTKKGQQGKPMIHVGTSWSFSQAASKPDLLSAKDYVRKVNLLSGLDENADPTWMGVMERANYEAGQTTDWFDYTTRTGLMQNYSAAVSGATEKLNYYLGATYTDQEGVVVGDDYTRFVLTSRLTSDITDWLQVGAQMNYSSNDYSGATNYDLYRACWLSPYGQPTRTNGEVNKYPLNEGSYLTNPLWEVLSNTIDDHDTYATTVMKGHLLLKCPWIKGLQFRMNGSWEQQHIERDYFTHEGYYLSEMAGLTIAQAEDRYAGSGSYLASANGYSARTKNTNWVWDNILSYNHQFGKHFVDLTAVYTRDSYEYYYRKFTGSDFTALGNTNLSYDGLNLAAVQKISSIDYTKHSDVGYLGRANYVYDEKYHVNLSVRRDGSSVFGANHKWGTFPAVGVAWTASNEEFWKDNSTVNYGKLKLSWGKNGNQSLSPYQTISKIALGQSAGYIYQFGNSTDPSWGQRISTMGNEDLGWETTTSLNYGFELGFLNDRIRLEYDGYFSKTTDQIFQRTIPVMINGLTSMYATMGQVNNWGIEINLNTVNIQTKDLRWSSMLNFYLNRNKLKELYGDGQDDISNGLFLGKSLGAIYGYKNIGIVQEEDTDYMEANGAKAGDVKFADIDGDGKITSEDRTILGYKKENFRMSFGNTIEYKNFTLYALFTGVFSGGGYGKAVNTYAYATNSDMNQANNLNHGWWTAENRSNIYPRVDYKNSNYTPVQSWGFVRLADLNLAYNFKQPWVKRLGIQNLQVYCAAKNLFTITGWDGGDPEIQQTLGSYTYGYPLSRTISFGLNLTL